MADLSAAAPTSPEREHWLHDQSKLPAAPERSAFGYVAMLVPVLLGILFAAGLVALAFEVRASWESHRDWVVPVTIPLIVVGGVSMAYLVQRRAIVALSPAILFLTLTGLFVGFNIARGAQTEGSDGGRDALSILGGVSLGLAIACLVGAMIWVESTRPTRAPAPEA